MRSLFIYHEKNKQDVIILTSSGWGQHQADFNQKVDEALLLMLPKSQVSYFDILQWQNPSEISQKLHDVLDFRSAENIFKLVAVQLKPYYDYARRNSEKIIIISYSTGCIVVENAMIIMKQLMSEAPIIEHVMLAPPISGSEFAKLAVDNLPIALGTGTAIGIAKTDGKSQKAMAIGGLVLTGLSILADNTLLNKLSKYNTVIGDYIDCARSIIMSDEDEVIRPLSTTVIGAKYYQGSFSHSQIGDLSQNGLLQIYEEHNSKRKFSKQEIIKKALS